MLRCERAEGHGRIGGQAQRAAIFELDFRAAVRLRGQLHVLCNRHIEEGLLKSLTRAAVNLHGSLDLAEADDAGVRLGQCGIYGEGKEQPTTQSQSPKLRLNINCLPETRVAAFIRTRFSAPGLQVSCSFGRGGTVPLGARQGGRATEAWNLTC